MENGRSRRVLIADAQPIFRLGLMALLESAYPDWNLVESESVSAYRDQLRQGAIDLLIVDSNLLGQEFAQCVPMGIPGAVPVSVPWRAPIGGGLHGWVDIIAITEPDDAIGALGCLAVGARATISRADPTSRTLASIDIIVMHGASDDGLRNNLRAPLAQRAENAEAPQPANLTARQLDVLRLLAKGQSNKVIARDLGVSVSTVKVHLNTVFRTLGVRNRVEAVIRAQDKWYPRVNS